MLTRGSKIAYDFNHSPYRLYVGGLWFVFSSENHIKKFKERLDKSRDKISASLSNRFNIFIQCDAIADIMLYREIEKRGFLIITAEGEKITCLNKVQFVGGKLTKKRQEKQ